MSLINLDISPREEVLPDNVASFISEANDRIEQFVAARLDEPVHGFVASDYPLVYNTLRTIVDVHLAPGDSFCEWGSGMGVVACLASLLGFDACGIEIDHDLANASQRLADDFDIAAEFAQGSFIPEGGDKCADEIVDFHWLVTNADSAYDELDLQPDDFAVIFAYPWPGEEHVIEQLFDRYASAGAVLVTYHGTEGIRIRRKRHRRR